MATSRLFYDITRVHADAIVNTCNPKPIYAAGTDGAIYRAAGAEELLAERKKIGDIHPGDIAVTPAFRLPAKYIIHASGPVWKGGANGEFDILTACYRKSLEKAVELGCKSIAFPLMATGVYGFPKEKALQIALGTIQMFVMAHDITVFLVIFSEAPYKLSLNIFPKIDAFIDSNEVEEKLRVEYLENEPEAGKLTEEEIEQYLESRRNLIRASRAHSGQNQTQNGENQKENQKDTPKKGKGTAADEALASAGVSFHDKLFEYIARSGLDSKEIYSAANMDRKLYSKICGKKEAKPKKKNVLSLAIGLHLNMDETKDLLARADCALNPHDKLDLAVEAFIRDKEYDIGTINWYLFSHKLDTLGDYGQEGLE